MQRRYWLLLLAGIALLAGGIVLVILMSQTAWLPSAPQLVAVGPLATQPSPVTPPPATVNPTVTPQEPATEFPTRTPTVTLTITPVIPSPIPISPTPITHIVGAGEGLLDIARRYGVTAAEIVALNNLGDQGHLSAGQALSIPVLPTPVLPTPTMTANPTLEAAINVTVSAQAQAVLAEAASAADTLLAETLPVEPLPAGPLAVSGVPVEAFLPLSPEVREHMREIYAQGQALGNDPRAFSKLGDSTIANPFFLAPFDTGTYTLGDYAYLQPVIDYFAGSFGRESVAVQVGLHSWSVFDPQWADAADCEPDETVIACEFRLHRPSFLFIRLGANDADVPGLFEENMRQIVTFALENGVIPILGTKADRYEDPDNINNDILRQIAADYQVPLWDFDLIAGTIPDWGLDVDRVHMTVFPSHDYTSPLAFQHGHSVHNLTALIELDRVWRAALSFDVYSTADGS